MKVTSRDGTTLDVLTTGHGPALLIVPGALTTAVDHVELARALAPSYTTHIIERRGRGASGPQGPCYGIERECEDVAAVASATGARYLFGHSYGGFVVLEAARRIAGLAGIAVFDAGVSIGGSLPMDWATRYERDLRRGRRLAALTAFARATGPESAARTPQWLMCAVLAIVIRGEERARKWQLLEANLREHREISRRDSTHTDYGAISAPVLVMYGGRSGRRTASDARSLADVIPRATLRECADLGHFAPEKRPVLVASEITRFLNDPDGDGP